MIENTIEQRRKFLLHCYAEDKNTIKSSQGKGVVFGILNIFNNPDQYYSELTPLSMITDEHAIEVSRIFHQHHYSDLTDKEHLRYGKLNTFDKAMSYVPVYNFLISKGYYFGDGTEIKYGWAVLKTDK